MSDTHTHTHTLNTEQILEAFRVPDKAKTDTLIKEPWMGFDHNKKVRDIFVPLTFYFFLALKKKKPS